MGQAPHPLPLAALATQAAAEEHKRQAKVLHEGAVGLGRLELGASTGCSAEARAAGQLAEREERRRSVEEAERRAEEEAAACAAEFLARHGVSPKASPHGDGGDGGGGARDT